MKAVSLPFAKIKNSYFLMPRKIKIYLLFFFYFISVNIYSQSSEILVNKSYIPKLTKIYGLTANQLLKDEVNDNLLFLDASGNQLEQLENNNVKYSILDKIAIKNPKGTSLKNGSPEIISCYYNGKLEEDQVITIYLEGKNNGSYTGDEGYLTISLPDFNNVISYGSTLKHSEKASKGQTIYTSNGTTTTAKYVVIDGYQTGWYSGQSGKVWAKVKLYKSGRYYIHGKMNIGNARYPSSSQGYSGDQQGWPVVRYYFDVKAPIHNDFWITNQHLSTYNATPGQHITAYCYINYKGNSSSTLNPSVRCYLSKDKNLSGDDIPLGYEYSSLSSSDTKKYLRISNTIPKNTNPGNYYFLFKADDGNRIKEDNENNNVAYRTLTIKNAKYTVSGTISSDQNNFDKIKGAKVVIDGNSGLSCITDQNGHYEINNVPAGNRNIKVTDNYYSINSSSATIDVSRNTVKNFTGHCSATPQVTYNLSSNHYTPGTPFEITVNIKNIALSVREVPVYLDVSFPDISSAHYVKVKNSSGFDSGFPQLFSKGQGICVLNRSTNKWECQTPAQYLLVTASRNNGITFNEKLSYTLTVTPPNVDQLKIYLKGSIGDQRYPSSGTIGQQGIWEKVITLNKLQSYTVSGNVHSDQNSFDVIKDAKVTIDGNSSLSCKTDDNGNYVIKNVPAGSHNITVSNNDYQFTHSSASINVNKNLTQNFTGHCKGIPSVSYEIPENFVPGKPFTITVKIKNKNYAVSNAPVYLDVSFPDFTTTKYVKLKENNGFDDGYPQPYEKQVFNAAQRKFVPAQYLLWSGYCSRGISFNETHSYSLTVTPPDKDKLRIYIKGSIGDQRDPTSGTIGQQGVWEKVITLNKLQNYTVSGKVHSDQNDFDVIKDVKVTIDGNSSLSCKTDENGDYVIKNVPAGSHNITVSNNDYQFTHSSASINVNKNLTQNFTGHCKGIPSVSYEIPKDFVPGKPFTITVKIKNDNYSVSNAPVYLDVSFPDFTTTKYVKLKENNGFDDGYPQPYENQIFDAVQRKLIPAQYLLWSGYCSSGLRHAETHSYSLTVTPPDKDKLRIYIKGSIGDNRYPLPGTLDNSREGKGQQGVYEEVVTINKKKEYPAINIPVLMYHNVDDISKSQYWVSTKNFKDQMNFLKSYGYNTITLNDILDYINTGKPLPDNPVVLSFDDGYENLYTKAYPILKKLNFKAISFLITNYIGNTNSDRKTNTWDPDPTESSFHNPHLIWPEIKEMADNGITFGSHTKTHPHLTKVSAAELKEQVEGSKQAITAKLGKCDFFCYPFGDINDQVENEVKNAGYLAATDIDKGRFFNTRTSDLYRIERLYIPGNMDINAFARKINPNIQFPKLDILGVQFYDENNQPKSEFTNGEKVIIKIRVKNTGPTVKSVVSLNLDADDDDNTAPLYDTHLISPTGDKVVTLTNGEEKTVEFEWQIPQNTTVKQWYYNIGFHGEHYCLWYGGTNWTKGFSIGSSIKTFTVYGVASSNQNNYDKIIGATVTIDDKSTLSATTDGNGFYQIKNVSSGEHTISISHSGNGYYWENNDLKFSKKITLTKNKEVNFKGTCRALPEIININIPKEYTPGKPITISFDFNNKGFAVSNVIAYVDVSFPDISTKEGITFKKPDGFLNPVIKEKGDDGLYKVIDNKWTKSTANYLLYSFERNGIIYHNKKYSFTMNIPSPKSGDLKIDIKTSIGDSRWPSSEGVKGQQNILEKEFVVKSNNQNNIVVPDPDWNRSNTFYFDLFGKTYRCQYFYEITTNENNQSIITYFPVVTIVDKKDSPTIETPITDLKEFSVVTNYAMKLGDGSSGYLNYKNTINSNFWGKQINESQDKINYFDLKNTIIVNTLFTASKILFSIGSSMFIPTSGVSAIISGVSLAVDISVSMKNYIENITSTPNANDLAPAFSAMADVDKSFADYLQSKAKILEYYNRGFNISTTNIELANIIKFTGENINKINSAWKNFKIGKAPVIKETTYGEVALRNAHDFIFSALASSALAGGKLLLYTHVNDLAQSFTNFFYYGRIYSTALLLTAKKCDILSKKLNNIKNYKTYEEFDNDLSEYEYYTVKYFELYNALLQGVYSYSKNIYENCGWQGKLTLSKSDVETQKNTMNSMLNVYGNIYNEFQSEERTNQIMIKYFIEKQYPIFNDGVSNPYHSIDLALQSINHKDISLLNKHFDVCVTNKGDITSNNSKLVVTLNGKTVKSINIGTLKPLKSTTLSFDQLFPMGKSQIVLSITTSESESNKKNNSIQENYFVYTSFDLKSPDNNSTLTKETVNFKWTKINVENTKYELIVTTSPDLSNVIYKHKTDNNEVQVSISSEGKYYWLVNAILPSGETIVSSSLNTFYLNLKSEPIIGLNTSGKIDFGKTYSHNNLYTSLNISNNGNAPLIINDIKLTGENKTSFTILGTYTFPIEIAQHNSLQIKLSFTPVNAGSKDATLIINNNSVNAPTKSIILEGSCIKSASLSIANDVKAVNSSITVPITATDFTNIKHFQFSIFYDNTKLEYVNNSNWASGTNISAIHTNTTTNPGVITFSYNDTPISISSGKLVDLNFKLKDDISGKTDIIWSNSPVPRKLYDSQGAEVPCTYNNGSVYLSSGHEISGHLTYANSDKTPLSNVSVSLVSPDNQVLNTTTTDNTGLYTFTGLADGDYTLKPDVQLPWGGVSAMDVTLYKKMIVQALSTTPFIKQSGDVDNNGSLSTMDLTFIKQRIIQKITTFNSGDWLYNPTSVTISGNNAEKDMQALCYGDANGSYKVNTSGNKSEYAETFHPALMEDETMSPYLDKGDLILPFTINRPVDELSSVTLVIKYPYEFLKVAKIEMSASNKDLLYNVSGGTIRLVFSTLNSLNLNTGDTLMRIRMRLRNNLSNNAITNEALTFSGMGEFGDYNGNVIKDIKLHYPEINIFRLKGEMENQISVYPNPARTRITVTGVEGSKVQVFDTYGNCVYTANPDTYKLSVDLHSFSPGTYTFRITKGDQLINKKFVVLSH